MAPMSESEPRERRVYHAPRRTRSAAETHATILEAAARLFIEHGYGKVTVGDIARESETAVPTVYASTGGKSAILAQLIEDGAGDPVVGETLAAVRAATDPRAAVTGAVHGTRVDNERYHDLLRMVIDAAVFDEVAAETLARVDRSYRDALGVVAGHLAALDALRPDTGPARAADILWFYLGHHSWNLWVADRGWSWDATEAWLAEQTRTALLAVPR
jgi:AcrR family transcriptional regulator